MARTEIDNFSIDCVIFGFDQGELKALFIKRSTEPDYGKMALPGGFVYLDEDLDAAPMRRLQDMTGLSNIYMQQVGAFGRIDRYPLRRVITVVYYALVRVSDYSVKLGLDASEVHWIPVNDVPELSFDHRELFDAALAKLRREVRTTPILFNLLPEEFTMSDVQSLYESVMDCKLDKRNFRRRLKGLMPTIIKETGNKRVGCRHRSAVLYCFDKQAYNEMIENGQVFSL